jgi:hypothetical protein
MGREATCHCQWNAESGDCKVLLETSELIVRGPIRRRVPIASLTQISVRGNQLLFHSGEDHVTLNLGASLAPSWAKKLITPPPSLAEKLGITPASHLVLLGEFETQELKTAVSHAATINEKQADLILVRVNTAADLNYALDRYSAHPGNPPIWIIYPKGPNHPINETEIRGTLRHESFIDTKVASVSTTLTALKFIRH